MAFTERPPEPPAPNVKLFNQDGTPTPDFTLYLNKLLAWMRRLAAAIP